MSTQTPHGAARPSMLKHLLLVLLGFVCGATLVYVAFTPSVAAHVALNTGVVPSIRSARNHTATVTSVVAAATEPESKSPPSASGASLSVENPVSQTTVPESPPTASGTSLSTESAVSQTSVHDTVQVPVNRDIGDNSSMPWLTAEPRYAIRCNGTNTGQIVQDSLALRSSLLVQAHQARVDMYAKHGPACTAKKVFYSRERYLAAQYSADALKPQFIHGCHKTACAVQLSDAPHSFRMFSKQEARALIEDTGDVLAVGDSFGRRLMYQLAEMVSEPPLGFIDKKDKNRFRTVDVGLNATMSFEWNTFLAGVIDHFKKNPGHVRKCKLLLLSLGIHDMWDLRKSKNLNSHIRRVVKKLQKGYLDDLVSLVPPTAHVILLIAPLPGPKVRPGGKPATDKLVRASRAAARRIGLPILDQYWWMVKNETVHVEKRDRITCAEAAGGKLHYSNKLFGPRRFLCQVVLNLLNWLGPRAGPSPPSAANSTLL